MLSAVETDAVGAVARLLGTLDLSVCDGCDGCGLRCSEGVPMTSAEYEAIEAFVAGTVRPPMDWTRWDGAAGAWVDLGDGFGFRACRFRDVRSGRCGIYPVRPLVCRLMGYVPWMPCPIGRVATTVAPDCVLAALDEYCRATRMPYAEWQVSNGNHGGN